MAHRRLLLFAPLVALLLLLTLPSVVGARTISWSGYTWDVRPAGTGGPGPNAWSDSTANVAVSGTDLLLSIVRDSTGVWTSAEIDGTQHLGYGTYRWVVATDLSTIDANEVLGMFTYGGSSPSNNEIDIEASHWGNLAWPSGSGTVWQDAAANLSVEKDFQYSSHPPYVNQFTWSPGQVHYLITDATGATLLDWTVTSGVPTPSTEVPVINYWRFNDVAPASVRTMRLLSFDWAPLGQALPPVSSGGGSAPSGGGGGGSGNQGGGSPPPAPVAGGGSASGGGGGASPPQPAAPVSAPVGAPASTGTQAGPPSPPKPAGVAPVVALRDASTCAVPGAPAAGAAVRVSLLRRRFVQSVRHRGGVVLWQANAPVGLRLAIDRLVRRGRVALGVLRARLHPGSGRLALPLAMRGRALRPGRYELRVAAGIRRERCAPADLRFTVLGR